MYCLSALTTNAVTLRCSRNARARTFPQNCRSTRIVVMVCIFVAFAMCCNPPVRTLGQLCRYVTMYFVTAGPSRAGFPQVGVKTGRRKKQFPPDPFRERHLRGSAVQKP